MGIGFSPLSRLVKRQAQHAGRRLGVVVKHLVEVAHAKQQQRIGTRRLGVLILLHHRRGQHARISAAGVACYQTAKRKGRGGQIDRQAAADGWLQRQPAEFRSLARACPTWSSPASSRRKATSTTRCWASKVSSSDAPSRQFDFLVQAAHRAMADSLENLLADFRAAAR